MITLVTGATGAVGRHVVRELASRGAGVRAFVRDAGRARAVVGEDVDLAVGDLRDVHSMRAAFDGVEQLFLACGNVPEQVELEATAVDAAADAGVRRIVKLSAAHAEVGSPLDFWDIQGRIEERLRSTRVAHVLLRPLSYMSTLFAAAGTVAAAGRVVAPAGDAKIAMIDPRDVAAVAAVALTEDGHDGRAYTLTGPEALTYHDVAEALSAVTGRPVAYVAVPDEAALAGQRDAGVPEWTARNVVTLFRLLREGAGAQVTDVVRVVTGREPRTLREFLADHAGVFRA